MGCKVSTNFDHTILGTNDNNNVFDSSTVIADRDGSLIERSEWVINALGGVQARFEQSASGTVEENSIQQFTISIFDLDAGAVASGSIDVASGPISAVISKSTNGGAFSTSGITQPTFAKATGVVACSYQFLAAEWQVGDMYRLVVGAIRATVDSEVVYIPDMIWSNIIKEAEELKTDVDAIRADYSIHTLFVIPEAVGSISADNVVLQAELAKLGEVTTITQADLLAHSELASYSLCALGTGTTWTGSNLASLKAFPDLPILCVDKVTAAYLELGTAQTDATTKTDITAVATIKGSMFGVGIHDITGLAAGANAVTSSATYHILNMSDADITESWYAYEDTNANTHVALGGIFRQQNNGALGVDEEAGRVTASMLFAGFCFDASALTTLGQDTYRLAALILIHERTIGRQSQVGTAGIGLFDLGGMSTAMKAEVELEATEALVADNLDHFMQAAVDTNLQTVVHDNSALGYALVVSAVSTFDRTLHSLEAIAGAVADLGGLAFLGTVTTANTTANFKVAGLAGKGTNVFVDKYYCQVIESDNAAPEGEIRKISAYTTADGDITVAVFSVAPDVGDQVLIFHESIYAIGQLADSAVAMNTASNGTQTAIMLLRSILERIGETPADPDDSIHTILGQTDDAIPAMNSAPGSDSVIKHLKAILERVGQTPADTDDSLHTVAGQRNLAIPAMNAAMASTDSLVEIVSAIKERLGATPADSDDPLHLIHGQRDSAADFTYDATAGIVPLIKGILGSRVVGEGTFTTGSATAPVDTGRGEGDDYWNGCLLMPIVGNAAFQPRRIVAYNGTTDTFTIDPSNPFAPATGTELYIIIADQTDFVAGVDNAAQRTPADVIGNPGDTIPGMNGAMSTADSIFDIINAIKERLGATPADSDDPLHIIHGQRDDAADFTYDATTGIVPLIKGILGSLVVGEGTFTTGSTTEPIDTGRDDGDDYWNGCMLMPLTGNAAFQPRLIVDYDSGTDKFYVDPSNPFKAATGTVAYVILSAQTQFVASADLATIRTASDAVGNPGDTIPAMNAAMVNTDSLFDVCNAIKERLGATAADTDDPVHTILGQRDLTIPAMDAAMASTDSLIEIASAIKERLGATPADSDDPLHLIHGQRDDAAPAMNAAPADSDSIIKHLKAIRETVGQEPADADDSLHTLLGQRDAAATDASLSDITTTSALAKLRLLLLRFSAAAFSTTIDPGGAARTTLENLWTDLGAMLAGAGGITTWPTAAPPADGISLAEAIRDIWDALRNGTGGTEPATNKSVIDALGVTGSAAISEDFSEGSLFQFSKGQHNTVHTLFVIPEAVGDINADNTVLQTELAKLGEIMTITQADLLAHAELSSYTLVVLGTNSGTAWTPANLADLKLTPDLPILCVDKVAAAYLEIGTDGGDAAAKTDINVVATIKGSILGVGACGLTGLATGANVVSDGATFHTLTMVDADITETWWAYETTGDNTDVVLGGIFKQQNDGTLGVDEEGGEVTASMIFAGFCYDASELTTLGKSTFKLAALILIHERTVGQVTAIIGTIRDFEKEIIGNQKNLLSNATPLADFISGSNAGVGTVLPASKSIYDLLLGTVDGVNRAIGKLQIAATTIDLDQAAGTDTLFTGTTQSVLLTGLTIRIPNVDISGGALTSISIQTDDATPAVLISTADGVLANLTEEATLTWSDPAGILIPTGTLIQLTIAGGAAGVTCTCNIVAQCRAVVNLGYLA